MLRGRAAASGNSHVRGVAWEMDGGRSLGIRATGLMGDARNRGDPERRFRIGLLALLVTVMVVGFALGTWAVIHRVRHAMEAVAAGQTDLAVALRHVTLEIGGVAFALAVVLTLLLIRLIDLVTSRSFRDHLTGLHNLPHFESSAFSELARMARHGRSAAVLVVDVRRLRDVNDALGHRAGDSVLRTAGELLKAEMRPSDYLSRVGGQFLILVDEVDEEGAEAFARRITAALERTVQVTGNPVRLRAAAGIALFPSDGASLDELLANAESALREAKKSGQAFVAFSAGLVHSTAETLALESDLEAALVNGELTLHGQPVIELETGRVAGVEVLARWQHPQRGLLPPSAFIPQAEESGLIRQLDRWALDAAAATVADWAARGYQGFITVNLSGQSVADAGLPAAARRVLERHGAPAGQLVLEVTETAAIRDLRGSRNVLNALKALGLRVALDDFGTGYSSLAYLRRLPVDLIKIDRQFTENVAHQASDQHLIRALVMYARGLGLDVVAEGIETAEQHRWLERAGILWGQGYLYGAPTPLTEPPETLAVPTPRAGEDAADSGGSVGGAGAFGESVTD